MSAAPGKILTIEQAATIKRINELPVGKRIEEISRIQRVQETAVAQDQAVVSALAIWARQGAIACRGVLTAMPHPLVDAGSLEHYRGQINAMVVLLFESAGRWGVDFDAVVAAGKPIYDLEVTKRTEAEAKEAAAAKAREAEAQLAAPVETPAPAAPEDIRTP